MIKKIQPNKNLITSQDDLDTLYDTMVKERVFAKYSVDKQLALLMKDKTSTEWLEFENFVNQVKEEVANELQDN